MLMKRAGKLLLPVLAFMLMFTLAGADVSAAGTKDAKAAPEQTPNPNDPDSPELFVPEEGEETYVKVWDVKKEEWIYASKEDVPHSLPDPNDSDNPERITILDDGETPRTYIKVSNSEEEGYVYVLDEDLSSVVPKTADVSTMTSWILMGLVAVPVVIALRPRRKNNG